VDAFADVALSTVVPIALLVGAGVAARATGVLREGDARVLNAYIYWFALPALFVSDLAGMGLDRAGARFVAAGALPVLVATAFFALLARVLRLARGTFVLLAVSTAFGSLAFFGIPFVIFAFPGREAERLATLAAAGVSVPAVAITVALLEYARVEAPGFAAGLRLVASRLVRNPLLLAIAAGTALSLAGAQLPLPVERPLHMLGTTTATVAFFMLGVFLHGRRYVNLAPAAGLALLRLALLPLLALGAAALAGLTGLERTTAVLMNGVPVAVSLLVLSERYGFHRETIASLVLISSAGGALTLNLWLAYLR
jgi:malonate transporter and related proteins